MKGEQQALWRPCGEQLAHPLCSLVLLRSASAWLWLGCSSTLTGAFGGAPWHGGFPVVGLYSDCRLRGSVLSLGVLTAGSSWLSHPCCLVGRRDPGSPRGWGAWAGGRGACHGVPRRHCFGPASSPAECFVVNPKKGLWLYFYLEP